MAKIPLPQQILEAKEKRAVCLDKFEQRAAKIEDGTWDEAVDGPAFEAETRELESAKAAVDRLNGIVEQRAQAQGWSKNQGVAILHDNAKDVNVAKNYRLGKVIETLVKGGTLEGLSLEMHQEGITEMRAAGLTPEGSGGIIVPTIVSASHQWSKRVTDMTMEQRDMTVGTVGNGGYTVATDLGDLIPFLDPTLLFKRLGVTFLTDLQGNLDIPRRITRPAATAVAEQGALTEGTPTFDKISLTPKRYGVTVESSLQLVRQSSVSVENMLRMDLMMAIEELIEQYGINGSGSSNQPTGILATVGIGSVVGGTNGAVPDWADMTALELALFAAKAGRGLMAYVTTPGIANVLKNTKRDIAGNNFIWEGRNGAGDINGYPAATSTLVPSTLTKGSASGICHAILFGNWRELIVAQWGGMEIIANPYSLDTTGSIRYTVNMYTDMALRHPQSFAAMQDALLA